MLNNNLPRYTTRNQIARALGSDPRSQIIIRIRPAAYLVIDGKETELFEAVIPSAICVNAAQKH